MFLGLLTGAELLGRTVLFHEHVLVHSLLERSTKGGIVKFSGTVSLLLEDGEMA